MSWLCTSEKALQAKPAQLHEIAAVFVTNETETGDAAQAVIDLGVAGWQNFSGEMEIGFGNLVQAAGASMKSMAAAAGEAEGACTTAAETLDALEIESDALLVTAEEQLTELDALVDEANEWATKRYWRGEAVEHARPDREASPDVYATAVRRLRDADVAIYWINAAADLKREELNTSQATFDRIRDDEKTAQTDLTTATCAVYDTVNSDEIKFCAADVAAGVDIVLDIFDLAYLAITVENRDDSDRRAALLDARTALAALVGADTTERDEAIERIRAQRYLEQRGPEEIARLIDEALEAGDTDQARRLAELLFGGIDGMSHEEAARYLWELSSEELFVLFSLATAPPHPAVADLLARFGEGIPLLALSMGMIEILADAFPDPSEDPYSTLIYQKVFAEILAQDGGYEALVGALGGEFGPVSPHTAPELGDALLQHLLQHPELLRDLVDSDYKTLQNVLEAIGKGDASESDWNDLVGSYISTFPLNELLEDGSGADPWAVWTVFGSTIGRLQAQIGDVGGVPYDYSGIVKFAVKQGIGAFPGGGAVNTALSGIEALVGGYQSDETYKNLAIEERADRDRFVLAMTALVQTDPVFAEQLVPILDSLDSAGSLAAIDELRSQNTGPTVQIKGVAEKIEIGRMIGLEE